MTPHNFKKLKKILLILESLRDNEDLDMKTRLEFLYCSQNCEELLKEIKSEKITESLSNSEEKISEKKLPKEKKELKKLFIVDDDEDIQRMLSFTLKKRGFYVISETDPLKAIEKIKEIKPEIILLDLMMPGMTGFEFLDQVRKNGLCKDFKIIVGSSRNFEKDRITVLEAGANDFISKPYNITELALKLHSLLV